MSEHDGAVVSISFLNEKGDIVMELSEALKRFRKEQKITQKQAAAGAGVAERLYQSYEYGKVVPSAAVLIALADSFGVSMDYLAGRTDKPEVNQ